LDKTLLWIAKLVLERTLGFLCDIKGELKALRVQALRFSFHPKVEVFRCRLALSAGAQILLVREKLEDVSRLLNLLRMVLMLPLRDVLPDLC
jgi:hypothetical protein